MPEFITKFIDWFKSTQLPQQITEIDYTGLFTNPYFLIPFLAIIAYLLYKQAFKDLIMIAIFTCLWIFSGSQYIQEVSIDGELQLSKVLPLVFGGAAIMGVIIYMYFVRSD